MTSPGLQALFPLDVSRPGEFWRAVWLHFTLQTTPAIWYPILPWFPLMARATLTGRWLAPGTFDRPGPWWRVSIAAFAVFAAVRFAGPWFTLVDEMPDVGRIGVLMLCRQPPSLAWLAWNLGLASLMYAGLATAFSRRTPGVARADARDRARAARVLHDALPDLPGARAAVEAGSRAAIGGAHARAFSAIGVVILTFTCRAVGRLRERHPRSLLRFI